MKQEVFKIQASEEVLENVQTIQIEEVKVSGLDSLNYKAFDIKLKGCKMVDMFNLKGKSLLLLLRIILLRVFMP